MSSNFQSRHEEQESQNLVIPEDYEESDSPQPKKVKEISALDLISKSLEFKQPNKLVTYLKNVMPFQNLDTNIEVLLQSGSISGRASNDYSNNDYLLQSAE